MEIMIESMMVAERRYLSRTWRPEDEASKIRYKKVLLSSVFLQESEHIWHYDVILFSADE